MKKYVYKASLILNGVFLILFILLGLNYREKIIQKFLDKKEKATIVLFGDSIIKGGEWNDLLDRNDVKNSGFGGFTTSHLRWLIEKNVIEYDPKICFVEGGINDIAVGIPLERIKTNYKSLIDTLISNDITPIVQSTLYQVDNPESKIMVDSLNNFLIDYCNQKSIRYLDINSKLSTDNGLKPEYSTDGTHITESAYLIWGKEIQKILKKQ
jgi:alpha-glucosidase